MAWAFWATLASSLLSREPMTFWSGPEACGDGRVAAGGDHLRDRLRADGGGELVDQIVTGKLLASPRGSWPSGRRRSAGGCDLARASLLDDLQEELFESLAWPGDLEDALVARGASPDDLVDLGDGRIVEGIGLDGRAVLRFEQRVACAFFALLAAVENDHPVHAVFDVGEQVAGQQDRLAAPAELDDQVLDLPRADRIKAGGGLVEDEEIGIVDESLGDADARCIPLSNAGGTGRCSAPPCQSVRRCGVHACDSRAGRASRSTGASRALRNW